MKKETQKARVGETIINYQAELAKRISDYLNPPDVDPKLFLVRLIRNPEISDEAALKIFETRLNYFDPRLIWYRDISDRLKKSNTKLHSLFIT